jgi:PEP-CTERM motif
MSISFRRGWLTACAALLFGGAAQATPIEYIFTGIGSGSVGSSAFTNSSFTFEFTTNTTDVPAPSSQEILLFGLGGTFSEGSFSETLTSTNIVGENMEAGFQRLGFFNGSLNAGLALGNSAFGTYLMTTSLGPINETGSNLFPTFGGSFATTGGGPSITITSDTSLTFTAIAGTAAPEPSSTPLVLFGTGLLAFAAIRRGRRA